MEPIERQISVFIVDDENLILNSFLVYLEDVGFQASGYSLPEEALQAVKDKPPDVCIVDLRMPGMNGEDLVKSIHSVSPTVRCMILTGTLYDLPKELKAIGMTQEDVISKPINNYPEFFKKLSNLALR